MMPTDGSFKAITSVIDAAKRVRSGAGASLRTLPYNQIDPETPKMVHQVPPIRYPSMDASHGDDQHTSGIEAAAPASAQSRVSSARKLIFSTAFAVCSGVEWCFGLVSMIIILSVLATTPVLQFLSLGYLLESSGRFARTKRLRDSFVGIRTAARLGAVGLGIFLTLLPVRFLSSLQYSSYLLNGETGGTAVLRLVTLVSGLIAISHIAWAIYRGGRLRDFVWPAPVRLWKRVREGGIYHEASHRLLQFSQRMRLPYYFSLGLRGFFGALIWLCFPVTMMAFATQAEDPEFGGLIAAMGGLLFGAVLVYVPFLQTRLAITNRFASMFEIRAVREQFRRAPIAYWVALLMTLALAIPLYILKAELVPREAAWLPSLFFVAFMWPARIVVGWAVGRADKSEKRRHWVFRGLSKIGMAPVALIFALVVYFSQFTSWYGAWSLYEQHAFMVPVPFLGY